MSLSLFDLRAQIKTEYFTDSEVATLLHHSPARYSKVKRLNASGHIIALKRGFYVFGPKLRRTEINTFTVANLLYGPSYVSLESALSLYGMIPEAVKNVTSVNTKQSKRFDTGLGMFIYRQVPLTAFGVGVIRKSTGTGKANFLIATPEKAVLDKLFLDYHYTQPLDYLRHNLRIEETELIRLEVTQLEDYAAEYHSKAFSKRIQKLILELRDLQND